jgi:hypothetical protein
MSIKKNVLVSSPDTIFQRDEVRQIAVNFAKLPKGTSSRVPESTFRCFKIWRRPDDCIQAFQISRRV